MGLFVLSQTNHLITLSSGPILEPVEFRERYFQFTQGKSDALQVPGQLIAMALVVWAASFGINEYGLEDSQEPPADTRQRKDLINEMLQEMLYLIDLHGILRKASWDGVRLLLLLLPLTQGMDFTFRALFHLITPYRDPVPHGSISRSFLHFPISSLLIPVSTRSCMKPHLVRSTTSAA